jgi:hypothetical protein
VLYPGTPKRDIQPSSLFSLLEIEAEPLLEVIGNPDGAAFEELGRRRPGIASRHLASLLRLNCSEEAHAHQQADIATAINPHVPVDVSDREFGWKH